jgi:hypothetical protein
MALFMSALSNTINGALPPSSICTFLTELAQLAKIILPTEVEPVNPIFLTVGCSQSALPTIGVFFFEVVKMLTLPGGKFAKSANLILLNLKYLFFNQKIKNI